MDAKDQRNEYGEPMQQTNTVLSLFSGFLNMGSSISVWGSSVFKRICGSKPANTHELPEIKESSDSNELLRKNYEDAFNFFKGRTLHIEVLRDNNIYLIYFPKLPTCDYLTADMIKDFSNKVDRSTVNSKV
jgi:hypothetical protein